ncbi:MAG: DUF1566 domain-containing protein [Comamonadaceae bacterium]|nr:DUF1566 domain-containing protein [Comamonadaceae bacterium]
MSKKIHSPRRAACQALLALAGAWLLCSPAAAQPTGLLNDTGQTQCAAIGSSALGTCTLVNTGDGSAMPRQDGRFGRDVASPSKVGGGAAGFDFSKVCMNGDIAGTPSGVVGGNVTGIASTGSCVASPTANTGASPAVGEWACTKDNVTNLIWSLQTDFGDWATYAQTTLPTATNNATRCGFNSGWRLPTRRELLGIVHYGAQNPAIDTNYFPDTLSSNGYWTSDTYTHDPSLAWDVAFEDGSPYAIVKAFSYHVRLVRSGQ